MLFLTGLVALIAAAGLALTSPAEAIICADDTDDACPVDDFSLPPPTIPEPATMALTALGLTALGAGYRSWKRK